MKKLVSNFRERQIMKRSSRSDSAFRVVPSRTPTFEAAIIFGSLLSIGGGALFLYYLSGTV
jgi:hypothetical protein